MTGLESYLAQLVERAAPSIVVSQIVKATADRVLERIFGKHFIERLEAVEQARERIEQTLYSMSARIDNLGQSKTAQPADAAGIAFVDACLEASATSPTEEKRLLLGDLAAARIFVETESFEELTLRQAHRIIKDSTSDHLLALVRLMIVTQPPLSFNEPLPTADVVGFAEGLIRATARAKITRVDMDYLISINAIVSGVLLDAATPWGNYVAHWNTKFQIPADSRLLSHLELRLQQVANPTSRLGDATSVTYGGYRLSPAGFRIASDLASRLCPLKRSES